MLARFPHDVNVLVTPEIRTPEAAAVVRETRREMRALSDALISTYNETRDAGPRATVAALVDALGYDAAAVAVAEMISASSVHDGRIDDRNRAWAASMPGVPSHDAMQSAGFYGPDSIHPCHRDAIADAMRRAERPALDAETAPDAVETAETAQGIETPAETAQAAQDAPETVADMMPSPETVAAAYEAMRAETPVLFTAPGKKRGPVAYVLPPLFDETRQRLETGNGKTGIPGYGLLSGRPDADYTGAMWAVLREACNRHAVPMPGTCPGCGDTGHGHCPGCYALKVTRFPVTSLKGLLNTLEAIVNPARFIALIERELYAGGPVPEARIHAEGDLFSVAYARAVLDFVARHPETRFGSYTKSAEILDALGGAAALPSNLSMQSSPWIDDGVEIAPAYPGLPQFRVDDGTDAIAAAAPHCPAVAPDGSRTGITCKQCGHCYRAKAGEIWAVYKHA